MTLDFILTAMMSLKFRVCGQVCSRLNQIHGDQGASWGVGEGAGAAQGWQPSSPHSQRGPGASRLPCEEGKKLGTARLSTRLLPCSSSGALGWSSLLLPSPSPCLARRRSPRRTLPQPRRTSTSKEFFGDLVSDSDNHHHHQQKRSSDLREMAPRIRLNLAKPLPTISEAFEDMLEDITSSRKGFGNVYMSPDSSTGENYLESICQISRSSFPVLPESKLKVQGVDKHGMLQNSPKVLNMSETSKMVPMYSLPNVTPLERNSSILDCFKTYSSSIVDPLEELYTEAQKTPQWRCHSGHENSGTECLMHQFPVPFSVQEKTLEKQNVASFFPRLPSPRPQQRDDSCPELKSLKNQSRMQTLVSSPNKKGNDLLRVNGKSVWLHPPTETPLGSKVFKSFQKRQQALKAAAFPEREQLKPFIYSQNGKGEEINKEGHEGYFHASQRATTFDWISEYQSAWKAAKVRACLLPAIAES